MGNEVSASSLQLSLREFIQGVTLAQEGAPTPPPPLPGVAAEGPLVESEVLAAPPQFPQDLTACLCATFLEKSNRNVWGRQVLHGPEGGAHHHVLAAHAGENASRGP